MVHFWDQEIVKYSVSKYGRCMNEKSDYVKRLDVERVFRNYGRSISVPSYERLPRGASTMTSVAERVGNMFPHL